MLGESVKKESVTTDVSTVLLTVLKYDSKTYHDCPGRMCGTLPNAATTTTAPQYSYEMATNHATNRPASRAVAGAHPNLEHQEVSPTGVRCGELAPKFGWLGECQLCDRHFEACRKVPTRCIEECRRHTPSAVFRADPDE